jgi:hypothetical protein
MRQYGCFSHYFAPFCQKNANISIKFLENGNGTTFDEMKA